jgi:hypothetical protein
MDDVHNCDKLYFFCPFVFPCTGLQPVGIKRTCALTRFRNITLSALAWQNVNFNEHRMQKESNVERSTKPMDRNTKVRPSFSVFLFIMVRAHESTIILAHFFENTNADRRFCIPRTPLYLETHSRQTFVKRVQLLLMSLLPMRFRTQSRRSSWLQGTKWLSSSDMQFTVSLEKQITSMILLSEVSRRTDGRAHVTCQ